jgi:hypothetical protein
MPTWYDTLRSLNHDACCSNCRPCAKVEARHGVDPEADLDERDEHGERRDRVPAHGEEEAGERSRDGEGRSGSS